MKLNHKQNGLIIVLFIFFAALSRLLPHPPNVTAVGAVALFGGAYLSSRWVAILIPIAAIWFSDILLNNLVYAAYYDGFVLVTNNFWFTAGAMFLIVIFGRFLLQKVSAIKVIGASIGASAIFFLISNFGVWATGIFYTKDITGLLAAYTAGLPFFLNTIAGDLFFCGLLFGSYALYQRYLLQKPSPATIN